MEAGTQILAFSPAIKTGNALPEMEHLQKERLSNSHFRYPTSNICCEGNEYKKSYKVLSILITHQLDRKISTPPVLPLGCGILRSQSLKSQKGARQCIYELCN